MTTLLTDFFAAQGVILDTSLLFAVAVITWGFVIQSREKRRERQEAVARAIAAVETMLFEVKHRRGDETCN